MLPAVTWDGDDDMGPSVLRRLREKASLIEGRHVDCQVVALIFVQEDSIVVDTATKRKDYFDARTGELWDLYFAGYYRWGHMPGGRPLTSDDDGPQFSPVAFDEMRRVVETQSAWRYSGECDLVLVNAYLAKGEDPVVDWESFLGGPLVDPNDVYRALSLGGVIEAISQAVERDFDSADWNVGDRLWQVGQGPDNQLRSFARDVLANAVANVLVSPLTSG